MEPVRQTRAELLPILEQLKQREPIFHRPEFGRTRDDFEAMTDNDYWEVGASGRRYSREYVLDVLEQRRREPLSESWETSEFHCQEIAPDNFLLTYTLLQEDTRRSRRTTLWRLTVAGWKIIYHQGTLVADQAFDA